jgi:hypothetical protein
LGDPELDPGRVVERMRETARPYCTIRRQVSDPPLDRSSALPAGRTVTLEQPIDAEDEGMYVDKQGKRESQPVWSI